MFEDVKTFKSAVVENRDLYLLLKSPIVNADKKESIIEAIFEGKLDELTFAFMKLLTRKGREQYLPEIADAFVEKYNGIKNITPVVLKTAVKVDDATVKKITEALNVDKSVGDVQLKTEVDESLIGGFVLQYNDKLYDASVIDKLKDLKVKFEDDSYIKKY